MTSNNSDDCKTILTKEDIWSNNEKELNKKWRRWSLKNHPDRNKTPGSLENFQIVSSCVDEFIKHTDTDTDTEDDILKPEIINILSKVKNPINYRELQQEIQNNIKALGMMYVYVYKIILHIDHCSSPDLYVGFKNLLEIILEAASIYIYQSNFIILQNGGAYRIRRRPATEKHRRPTYKHKDESASETESENEQQFLIPFQEENIDIEPIRKSLKTRNKTNENLTQIIYSSPNYASTVQTTSREIRHNIVFLGLIALLYKSFNLISESSSAALITPLRWLAGRFDTNFSVNFINYLTGGISTTLYSISNLSEDALKITLGGFSVLAFIILWKLYSIKSFFGVKFQEGGYKNRHKYTPKRKTSQQRHRRTTKRKSAKRKTSPYKKNQKGRGIKEQQEWLTTMQKPLWTEFDEPLLNTVSNLEKNHNLNFQSALYIAVAKKMYPDEAQKYYQTVDKLVDQGMTKEEAAKIAFSNYMTFYKNISTKPIKKSDETNKQENNKFIKIINSKIVENF
jgi:hypothetical protein